MIRKLKKTAVCLLMAAFMLNTTFVSAETVTINSAVTDQSQVVVSPEVPSTSEPAKPSYTIIAKGKVNSSILNIRDRKSTSGKRLAKLKKKKEVQIISTGSKWVQVKVGNVVGYTQGKYISTTYGNASNLYANAKSGTTTSSITIRKSKSSNSLKLKTVKKSAKIQVLTTGSSWVKVKYGDVIGYTTGKNIKLSNGGTAQNPNPYSSKGAAVVAYAKKFLGNRYVYGGSSLTGGTDCSGFTMSVYRHFGKSLPHSSYAQRSCGRAVHGLSNAKPGDLICYSGHVAIYMGNNSVIHASNPKDGIKITHGAAYRPIVAIRRIF